MNEEFKQTVKTHGPKIKTAGIILFFFTIVFIVLFIVTDPYFVQNDPVDSTVDVGEGNKVCKSCAMNTGKLIGISLGFSLIPFALYIGIKVFMEKKGAKRQD
jgi:hypothetical protein